MNSSPCAVLEGQVPDFPGVSEANVRGLEDIFGWRCGHTTVMHALTGVGLSVWPDTHLAKTVRAINLVPGIPKRGVPTRAKAVKINQGVCRLLGNIRSTVRTDIPDSCRCFDMVLIEISRKELLED